MYERLCDAFLHITNLDVPTNVSCQKSSILSCSKATGKQPLVSGCFVPRSFRSKYKKLFRSEPKNLIDSFFHPITKRNNSFYYINTSEIPSELSRENFISSHVKRSPSLWLHNKSRLWTAADWVFHWCLYNKHNITNSLMDMNFIFSCSTRYITHSLRSMVRYRVDHSKTKFISTRGHVIMLCIHWIHT